MAITGVIHPDRVIRNVGVQAWRRPCPYKSLSGPASLRPVLKKRKASAASVRAAVASMVALNDRGVSRHAEHARACVFGRDRFRAAGACLRNGQRQQRHDCDRVEEAAAPSGRPTSGASRDASPAAASRNREYLKNKTAVNRSVRDDLIEIALDPQTSGGLLIALPSEHADGLVDKLRSIRVDAAARIGYATAVQDVSVRLV